MPPTRSERERESAEELPFAPVASGRPRSGAKKERALLEKKLDLEANLRQELKRRGKEEQDLFASFVRDEGDLSHFGTEQEIGRRRMIVCNENLRRIMDALERLDHAS